MWSFEALICAASCQLAEFWENQGSVLNCLSKCTDIELFSWCLVWFFFPPETTVVCVCIHVTSEALTLPGESVLFLWELQTLQFGLALLRSLFNNYGYRLDTCSNNVAET